MKDLNILIDCLQIVSYNSKNKILSELLNMVTKVGDYEIEGIIARGGYGDVYLVKDTKGNRLALKCISKEKIHSQPFTALFMVERDIMIANKRCEYLICGHKMFQDEYFIYFLMDFIPNGDLIDLDFLSMEEIRIYGAEMLMAIEEVHNLGYIHRDIKPENILLDWDYHIKLADFGSAIKMENGKASSNIPVGTPDYISPEILKATGKEQTYGPEVDIWSYGITLYEMFYGDPPFFSEKHLHETYKKIENIDIQYPDFREDSDRNFKEKIPDNFKNLLENLICEPENRLKIEEIKNHPFFEGIDWPNLRKIKLKSKNILREISKANITTPKNQVNDHMRFLGFTYDPDGLKNISKFIHASELKYVQSFLGDQMDSSYDDSVTTNKIQEEIKSTSEKQDFSVMEIQEEFKTLVLEENDQQILSPENGPYEEKNENLGDPDSNIDLNKSETFESSKIISESLESSKIFSESLESSKILSESIENSQSLKNIDKKLENEEIKIKENDDKELEKLRKQKIKELQFTQMEEIKKIYSELLKDFIGIRSLIIWIDQRNKVLTKELYRMNRNNPETLKRDLKIKKMEIKELTQKLNNETYIRLSMEDEIRDLKKQIRKMNSSTSSVIEEIDFKLLGVVGVEKFEIRRDEDYIFVIKDDFLSIYNKADRLNSERDEINTEPIYKDSINNFIIESLRNTESNMFDERKKRLLAKITIIDEVVETSNTTRRSTYDLEKEIEKEEKMYEALKKLSQFVEGDMLESSKKQLEGSKKKLEQLNIELRKSKSNTIVVTPVPPTEKFFEFNNHVFIYKELENEICGACNSPLYGNNGLCCFDCHYICHPQCYCLVEISCELQKAMRKGMCLYIKIRSGETMTKLMKVLNKK